MPAACLDERKLRFLQTASSLLPTGRVAFSSRAGYGDFWGKRGTGISSSLGVRQRKNCLLMRVAPMFAEEREGYPDTQPAPWLCRRVVGRALDGEGGGSRVLCAGCANGRAVRLCARAGSAGFVARPGPQENGHGYLGPADAGPLVDGRPRLFARR